MRLAKTTGINPLSMSANNTIDAYFLPDSRNTLVAPGFLEPAVRGSGKSKIRLTMTAEHTDPSK